MALQRIILGGIAGGYATSRSQLLDFLEHTYFYHLSTESSEILKQNLDPLLHWLMEQEFLVSGPNEDHTDIIFEATKLGKATFCSCFTTLEVMIQFFAQESPHCRL
jgi:replicative superfamily II helicase